MRLDELNKPKDLTDFRKEVRQHKTRGTRRQVIADYLSQYGFKKLGSGMFAVVFEHPKYPNEVFKIFDDDPNTLKWLDYCHRNPSNPYTPTIKSKPIRITKDIFLVRMEKLKFGSDSWQETAARATYRLVRNWDYLQEVDHGDTYDFVSEWFPDFKNNGNIKSFVREKFANWQAIVTQHRISMMVM